MSWNTFWVCLKQTLGREGFNNKTSESVIMIIPCRNKVKEARSIWSLILKIDGVAPLMTDPPPISSTTLSEKKKKKKCVMWHVTCDTWHVTRDTSNMTRDMWHVTRLGGVNILSKFQLVGQPRLHRVCQKPIKSVIMIIARRNKVKEARSIWSLILKIVWNWNF